MGLRQSYRLRLKRRRHLARAWRKSRELRNVVDRSNSTTPGGIFVFSTLRNEAVRLPFFLDYYRKQGVEHFFIVDNDSNDGSTQLLAAQDDVTLFSTKASYKSSKFGVDWLNYLQSKYGVGHWCLVVDPDEFFVFPFCDSRPLQALTDWLDATGVRSFGAMLLDMYPKGPINDTFYEPGDDPMAACGWFDSGNYTYKRNHLLGNIWIQGGPRTRLFFDEDPSKAPALNKTPLVKWEKGFAYVSSTHSLLPRGLNQVYDTQGGEKASGVLLHTKFLSTFNVKAKEELARKQHYGGSHEYKAYAKVSEKNPDLWCKWSEKYINWRQLEVLGLMSKGNWA